MDAPTRALISNAEVIGLDQRAGVGRPAALPGFSPDQARAWVSTPAGAKTPDTAALFNLSDAPLTVKVEWRKLGLAPGKLRLRELWTGEKLAPGAAAELTIPPHGVKLLRVM
jgi:hypothetical protein